MFIFRTPFGSAKWTYTFLCFHCCNARPTTSQYWSFSDYFWREKSVCVCSCRCTCSVILGGATVVTCTGRIMQMWWAIADVLFPFLVSCHHPPAIAPMVTTAKVSIAQPKNADVYSQFCVKGDNVSVHSATFNDVWTLQFLYSFSY